MSRRTEPVRVLAHREDELRTGRVQLWACRYSAYRTPQSGAVHEQPARQVLVQEGQFRSGRKWDIRRDQLSRAQHLG